MRILGVMTLLMFWWGDAVAYVPHAQLADSPGASADDSIRVARRRKRKKKKRRKKNRRKSRELPVVVVEFKCSRV